MESCCCSEILILIATVVVALIAFVRWRFRYWERKNVPYVKPSFPMGNLVTKKGFYGSMLDLYTEFKSKGYKYGGMYSTLRPMFVPIDLDLLKCIMIKDFQYFSDRGVYYHETADPLSAHLFNIGGAKWRSLRTRLTPTFTSGKMKYMFETVMNCGDGLEKEIDKLYKNKEPVNIKEAGALFTTNVIGSCAFGLDCDAFTNPDNEFRSHTRKLFQGSVRSWLRQVISLSFPSLCKRLGVKVFDSDITKFYIDVVRDIVEHRESGSVHRNDFVQILVDIKSGAKSSEDSFTFEEIAAQAFIFFLAGFETSSSTMTFSFYEMAKNQEIQDKVRNEIRAVLDKHGGKLTYEAISEMTYLGQVFDETLRKYPIVAILERAVTKEYKIPGEDLVLEKGTKLLIPLQGIHLDPEYYPDPQKFDPDRFLPENRANRHTCEYMPFGEGPRICIGMRFGILQAKVGMIKMLKDHRYKLHAKLREIKFDPTSMLLSPLGDMPLDIEKVD